MSKNERTELNNESSGIQIETVSFGTPHEDVQRFLAKNRLISIDLQLTPIERESIQNLVISENIGDFEYRGSADDLNLPSVLGTYLKRIGDNSEEVVRNVTSLMVRFAEGSARFFDTKLIWIESRSFTPNNYFETPRWHTDAKFFNPYEPYKTVVALKGRQTRFGVTTDPDRFIELSALENKEKHGSEEDLKIREQLDEITIEIGTPHEENGAVFLVGGNNAIIHTEPRIDTQRLFFSVIAGPKEEMDEWYNRMDKKRSRKKLETKSKSQ